MWYFSFFIYYVVFPCFTIQIICQLHHKLKHLYLLNYGSRLREIKKSCTLSPSLLFLAVDAPAVKRKLEELRGRPPLLCAPAAPAAPNKSGQ